MGASLKANSPPRRLHKKGLACTLQSESKRPGGAEVNSSSVGGNGEGTGGVTRRSCCSSYKIWGKLSCPISQQCFQAQVCNHLLMLGKSLSTGNKDGDTCPVDDRMHPADISSAETSGALVPTPSEPTRPDQSGESPNINTPGGIWPWGPRDLTIFPRSSAIPPVDPGTGPSGLV